MDNYFLQCKIVETCRHVIYYYTEFLRVRLLNTVKSAFRTKKLFQVKSKHHFLTQIKLNWDEVCVYI